MNLPSLRLATVAVVLAAATGAATRLPSQPAPTPPNLSATTRAAVARAIPLLQQSAMRWYEQRQCSSCHHMALGTMALTVARERGFSVDDAVVADQRRRTAAELTRLRDSLLIAGALSPDAIGASYRLLGLAAAGYERDSVTQAATHMIAGKQHASGMWRAESPRPPLEDSAFTATALAVRALQLYGAAGRLDETRTRLGRAGDALARMSATSTEDASMRLFGLAWASAERSGVDRATRDLLAAQRPDGAWGQFPGRPGDAYATGQALVALNQAGGLDSQSTAYRRGATFLLETQHDDGSWLVETRRTIDPGQPYFETGFPHGKHQFISYAGSAWAVMALALAAAPGSSAVFSPTRSAQIHAAADANAGATALPLLLQAALDGDRATLTTSLSKGADANLATAAGVTPLMVAVADPAMVRTLLAAGARVGAASDDGYTALHVAAGYSDASESVQLLLGAGADIAATTKSTGALGSTPLLRAAASGDTRTLQQLLLAGARLDAPNSAGITPLLIATFTRDLTGVRWFLDRRANPNAAYSIPGSILAENGATPLIVSIAGGAIDQVRLLLARGADPNQRDAEGFTPLMHAAAAIDRGSTDILSALLAAGADPDASTSIGQTALTLADTWRKPDAVARLRLARR